MPRPAVALLAAALALVTAACADDDDEADGVATTTTEEETTTTTSGAGTTTSDPGPPDTPAAPDPSEAAATFLEVHFPGTRASLGAFRAGDAQSGEMEVLRPAEGGGTANLASTLLLRLDGDEWQVIAALNPNVTIDSPSNGDDVAAGPLTVTGEGRGFEAHIDARAIGADGAVVAEGFGSGGALAQPEPYEVQLDLAGVAAGTELVLVVAGGTGLEADPGEFSAIRITVV